MRGGVPNADGGGGRVRERAPVRVERATRLGRDGDEASGHARGGDRGVMVGDDVHESVRGGVDDDDVYVGVRVRARMLSTPGRAKVGEDWTAHRRRVEMGAQDAAETATGVG